MGECCRCRGGSGSNGGAVNGSSYNVRLVFHRDKLLYDIKNYAYIEGHKLDDDAEHVRHLTTDIGEDGNIDRVLRILSVVHAGVAEILYPYTKVEVEEDGELCDKLPEPRHYIIDLRVPATMSRTTLRLLERLIHEYMVYRVLYDWLSIVNPSAAESWGLKASATEDEIERAKNMRTGGLRRPGHPF